MHSRSAAMLALCLATAATAAASGAPAFSPAAGLASAAPPAVTTDRPVELGGIAGQIDVAANVRGLCVLALPEDGQGPAVMTRSAIVPGDDHPIFAFGRQAATSLTPGSWQVSAVACAGTLGGSAVLRLEAPPIAVRPGTITAGVMLRRLRATTVIEGSVVDAAGHPLGGVCVYATGEAGGGVRSATDGSYRLAGVVPGRYHLVARGCDQHVATLRGGAVGRDGSLRTVLVSGGGARGVTVRVLPGRRLRGRVVDPQGGTVVGACVAAGDRRTITDGRGRFRLDGVGALVRSLVVTSCARGQAVATQRVPVPSDRVVDVGDVEVQRRGEITGMVRDGDGLPVVGLVVTARPRLQPPDQTWDATDEQGRYRLRGLKPGRYVVDVNRGQQLSLPEAWSKGRGQLTGSRDEAAPIRVTEGTATTLSAQLGSPTKGQQVTIRTRPVRGAPITVDGIRRSDGATRLTLTRGTHQVQFGDVAGWRRPANQAVVIDPERAGGDEITLTGVYEGPLVRLDAEVGTKDVPMSLNGQPLGSGRIRFAVDEQEKVTLCAVRCLPEATAAALKDRILRPPSRPAQPGPAILASTLGRSSTVVDAEIVVDGTARGLARVFLPAEAGPHEIAFGDVPGYAAPLPHRVELAATEHVPVVARYRAMVRARIRPATAKDRVWIDRTQVGTGAIKLYVERGRHQVCAEADRAVRCTVVDAVDGQPLSLGASSFGG